MGKLFKKIHPPLFLYAIITFLSSRPASSLPPFVPDILSHGIEYFVLAYLFFRLFPEKPKTKTIIYGLLILFLLAFLDEFHQYFVPTRIFSVKDIMVDCMGIVLGLIFKLKLDAYAALQR